MVGLKDDAIALVNEELQVNMSRSEKEIVAFFDAWKQRMQQPYVEPIIRMTSFFTSTDGSFGANFVVSCTIDDLTFTGDYEPGKLPIKMKLGPDTYINNLRDLGIHLLVQKLQQFAATREANEGTL